jgi:hypothetical protein
VNRKPAAAGFRCVPSSPLAEVWDGCNSDASRLSVSGRGHGRVCAGRLQHAGNIDSGLKIAPFPRLCIVFSLLRLVDPSKKNPTPD